MERKRHFTDIYYAKKHFRYLKKQKLNPIIEEEVWRRYDPEKRQQIKRIEYNVIWEE